MFYAAFFNCNNCAWSAALVKLCSLWLLSLVMWWTDCQLGNLHSRAFDQIAPLLQKNSHLYKQALSSPLKTTVVSMWFTILLWILRDFTFTFLPIHYLCILTINFFFPFGALTLMVWRQEGIQPVKSWVLVSWWFDWSFARLTAPVVTTTSVVLSFIIIIVC